MKLTFVTLALAGSALAIPHVARSMTPSVSTLIPTPSSTPASTIIPTPTSIPVSTVTPTPTSTPVESTPVQSTPICSVDSDGDNGNHYGWCKGAKHHGTYKNGKSGDADNDGPSEEN